MGKKKAGKGGGCCETESKPADGEITGEGGSEKKGGGQITVVLKVYMHCEACAETVKRSVKGYDGVEGVAADVASGKLTVVGTKVDPARLRDRVERKTGKKAEVVSPAAVKKVDDKDGDQKKPTQRKDQKKPDEKKPKEITVSTVVLKIRLHCGACIDRIRRAILKINGVEYVAMEAEKDLVTVKGTMEPKKLPDKVREKLKRIPVEVVGPKKDKCSDGGKKDCGGGDGGEEKKCCKVGCGEASTGWVERCYAEYGYRVEMVHAPQLFSDENPNACSVM